MRLPFIVKGKITTGKQKGRTVNMPTANVSCDLNKMEILYGVYATYIYIDNQKYLSITNYGLRPSVDNNTTPTIETHILDFNQDIYNKEVTLEFLFFIRSIKKFDSLEDVKKQVEEDIKKLKKEIKQ